MERSVPGEDGRPERPSADSPPEAPTGRPGPGPFPAPTAPPSDPQASDRPPGAPGEAGRFALDTPARPPASRRAAALWLTFAVVGFAVGQVAAAIFAAVAAAAAGKSAELSAIARLAVPPEWYVVASLLGLWVGFLGGPLLASLAAGTRRLAADLGVRFRPIDLAGVALGLGGQIVVTALYAPFINHLKNFNAPTEKLTGAAHGGGFVVIAFFTVLGAPFFEELFFRGLLFKGLLGFFDPSGGSPGRARAVAVLAAVVLDGVLFGLAHGEWEQFAGLALFGMALAFVSYRTGRLGMNIVAHATFNLVAIVALASSRGALVH